MTNSNSTSKTIAIKDLELYWANLINAKSPFGAAQWDVQVRTTDSVKAEELKAAGVNLKKHEDGYYYGNIKRKTVSAKGQPLEAPKVIDKDGEPWDKSVLIGNGSKGNVKVFSYEYNVSGRSGTACMLTAVRVTDLVEYAGSDVEF